MNLMEICRKFSIKEPASIVFQNYCGPNHLYASFRIKKGRLPNGYGIEKILVAHEGNWFGEEGMMCHTDYRYYEDVQTYLGKGLRCIKKEYSQRDRSSLFLYEYIYNSEDEYILAVPATGEEIYIKIYGVDSCGGRHLLVEMEL